MIYEGIRGRVLAAMALVLLVAVPIGWKTGAIHDYQKARVEVWLELDEAREHKPGEVHRPNQAEQALWAVGSGQLLGRPSEEQKHSSLGHLPYLNTDFILAAWAEEHGFVGCLGLFALFFLLCLWGLRLARDARDRFDALVSVGVTAIIFWQFFINVGMVIGLLPVVGITLPFLSYGGSSLLTVLLGVGFLLNVALRGR
jgi:rod shape determining protein RodA